MTPNLKTAMQRLLRLTGTGKSQSRPAPGKLQDRTAAGPITGTVSVPKPRRSRQPGPPTPATTDQISTLTPLLQSLALTWSLPDLPSRITIVSSSRMTHTLARAYPKTGQIRISARVLASAPEEILREILCHEAAHVAAFLRHGRRVRPHGREWQALMCEAGYEPRVRLSGHPAFETPKAHQRPRRYELRCPVCGWTNRARTTNKNWRCANCLRQGRAGRLEVSRLEDAGRGQGPKRNRP